MATWGSINLLHPMYYVAGLDWPEYDFPEVFNPGGNGLVSAFLEPGILVVHPGTFSGRVTLGLDVVETAPSVDEASWDEIVEVSLVPSMSEVWILNEMGTPADGLPQLPGEGAVEAYRIRVHARGRDAADALTVDSSVDGIEEHLLVAWPAPVASENHIKLTDAVGRRRR